MLDREFMLEREDRLDREQRERHAKEAQLAEAHHIALMKVMEWSITRYRKRLKYAFAQLARMVIAGSALIFIFFVFADVRYDRRWIIPVTIIAVGLAMQGARIWWKRRP